MNEDHLRHFVCPSCQGALFLDRAYEIERDHIKNGCLVCSTTQHRFEVSAFIPRFVLPDDNTSAFGFEWNRHAKVQFDSVNGMHLSEERFFQETNWPKDLSGQKILEVGSGAGRFTEIALQTGAQVFSVDASRAVDANWNNNGMHPNLVLCQASLYELPFPKAYFDKVFCFGVLQHTPDVAGAFASIAEVVRPGGELAVDAYNKNYWRNFHRPMYLIRPITTRLSHERLHRWLSWSVPRLLPVSSWLRDNIPFVGRQVAALIPIANYNGVFPTKSVELLEEYAILDTFDTLSPKYISPQRPESVHQWFVKAGYEHIEFNNATRFAVRGTRKRIQKSIKTLGAEAS